MSIVNVHNLIWCTNANLSI